MELIQLLSQYPAATLIFVAWPLLFIWLLYWTQKESAKREERLMAANNKWQEVVQELTQEIKGLASGIIERIREELREELRRN